MIKITSHHLFREKDFIKKCAYCKADIKDNEWESRFYDNRHYKTTNCNCGKKITIFVNFHGSGHDIWLKKETRNKTLVKPLEHKINELGILDTYKR